MLLFFKIIFWHFSLLVQKRYEGMGTSCLRLYGTNELSHILGIPQTSALSVPLSYQHSGTVEDF